MNEMPLKHRDRSKLIIALIWSLAGFCFFSTAGIWLLIPYLAVQPDRLAASAIAFVSSPGIMVLCGMLTGLMSLLLWHPSLNKLGAIALAILIPVLLFLGIFVFAMSDTQGVRRHVIQAARSGSLTNTREQLLVQIPSLSLSQQLIQLGTNVNARDPEGRSVIYTASGPGRDPEILKLLLQSGAKPDAEDLHNAIFWGRLDAIQLMFQATSDDGKALIATLGEDALQENTTHTSASEADRAAINKLLIARGAK